MNSFIETLNQWGGNFLSFAWPALWQSSLLIAVLFAFDFLLRRKIRASIRYALWLVVLVKLCLPVTFALPTSPAWWLHKTPPPAVVKSETHFTVTYDDAPLPQIPQIPPPVFVPPKPAMTLAAWLLMISVSVSVVLLVWLLARWWQIARKVRGAADSPRLAAIAREAQKFLGLKSKVQVRLAANPMSPAVCGLFRPAILIPQPLADNFSDGQLRAVLLHELIHLRRRDVWMNFAQALLQIFYWWHPLVWLANARIRRVREEAVDDAVMLALRDEAESYAPTLLEVAKLALNRPLASLGLVGILESRHALRQRIERLVDFRPPRKAGLTLVSLLGILAFSAVAVPMGGGPSPTEDQSVSAPVASTPTPVVAEKTIPKTQILITSHFYWLDDANLKKVMSDLKSDSSGNESSRSVLSEQLNALTKKLESLGIHGFGGPRVVTINHETATISVTKGTNGIVLTCTPNVTNETVNLVINGTVNEDSHHLQFTGNSTFTNSGGVFIQTKSANTKSNLLAVIGVQIDPTNFFPKVFQDKSADPHANLNNQQTQSNSNFVQDAKLDYEMGKLDEAELKLKTALRQDSENAAAKYYLGLVQQTRQGANTNQVKSDRQIIVEKLNRIRLTEVSYGDNSAGQPLSQAVRDLSGMVRADDPAKTGINFLIESNAVDTSIKIHLINVRLADVLDAIVMVADKPIKYTIQDYGIVFSAKIPEETKLSERVFKVNENTFSAALQRATGLQTTNFSAMAKSYFRSLGVDFNSPPGKSVVFNDGRGLLYVRATETDLDTIEQAVIALNQVKPQVHIKARFVEVTQDVSKTSGADWYLGHFNASNNVAGKGGGSPSSAVPVSAANPMGNFSGNTVFNAAGLSNSTHMAGQVTGILTDTNYRVVLHALQQRGESQIKILGEPEGTTTSGRQMQMRATRIINLVTNIVNLATNLSIPENNATNSKFTVETENVETGPILDTVAYVLSDDYTISLSVTASDTEFFGYDKATNSTAAFNAAGERTNAPVVLPRFEVWQASANLNLYDGQTVVLGNLRGEVTVAGKKVDVKPNDDKKVLMVFITVTLLDPAGNRIHSDDEMPFAKKGVPSLPNH